MRQQKTLVFQLVLLRLIDDIIDWLHLQTIIKKTADNIKCLLASRGIKKAPGIGDDAQKDSFGGPFAEEDVSLKSDAGD